MTCSNEPTQPWRDKGGIHAPLRWTRGIYIPLVSDSVLRGDIAFDGIQDYYFRLYY